MLDSFEGNNPIILQPGDSSVPYTFQFSPSTSATANTGSIPYGTILSTVAVTAYNESGATIGDLIVSESNSSLVETILFKYPSTSGVGRYSIRMLVTLSSSAVMEFDFTRIYAKDISALK